MIVSERKMKKKWKTVAKFTILVKLKKKKNVNKFCCGGRNTKKHEKLVV